MAPVLTLLDGVRWHGTPIPGDRARTLLALLALHPRTGVGGGRLVDRLWPDQPPANPTKALQVVVSRTRAVTAPDAVLRTPGGYRLGLPDEQVDVLRLAAAMRRAGEALAAGRADDARRLAEEALLLGAATPAPPDGPLAELTGRATRECAEARRIVGLARSLGGDHDGALPLLEAALAEHPDDEDLLARLLRSEAAVRGNGPALQRYERHRATLRDRLGTDPGPELSRVHAELLAADRPVRTGLYYDASTLLGRDQDISAVLGLLGSHRVVSVVGPGGLGKTRLAHAVGRRSTAPVVHFVELVGVSSPDAVVGEVGAMLGVRDSVRGHRMLTARQRADVRARMARHLDSAPALLILDNCEHLVAAVAELVAYLVATTRDLRVLTTSRSPLSIPAEQVHPLAELASADAAALFRQRALAVRPGARIAEPTVTEIVTRLDGLPLAIELAAAKVRVMSADEVARRLADRFALLRDGDRTAPDRHRTLQAVIEWSWNLLDDAQRRALHWLSLFGDGFTLDAAERMLGPSALAAVHALADQSLLSVQETGTGLRYRMLETVREFGRLRLAEAGQADEALAAQRAWAIGYTERYSSALFGRDQFEAVDALWAEEGNLAELLRQALAEPDPATVVHLLAGLAPLWSLRGDHLRLIALGDAIGASLAGWTPPPELVEVTRGALVTTLMNVMTILEDELSLPLRDLLARLPEGHDTDPRVTAMTTVLMACDPSEGLASRRHLEQLRRSGDGTVVFLAAQMTSFLLENAGEPDAAADAAEEALALITGDEGPWLAAILHAMLASLRLRLGDHRCAVEHARAALPVLARMGSVDDETQMRAVLFAAAIRDGELASAERELAGITRVVDGKPIFGSFGLVHLCTAELALARGERERSLAEFRLAVHRARDFRVPNAAVSTGAEPWVMTAEAAALTAYAEFAEPAEVSFAATLFADCGRSVRRLIFGGTAFPDYPVAGALLFGLACWALLRDAAPAEPAIRMLVLAERFGGLHVVPVMAPERIVPRAERVALGRLEAVREEYGDRRGPALRDEAGRVLDQVFGPDRKEP
ncbi:SARP family transcriptional regulator [Actinocatenispora thailandica]|uniref:SARP family transcriptional regulator n=1 Tax=Actinocatenispora thailandica TaxID=227318 RepID=A0A7R7DTY7_9ACTN|nr:BTAD domain-containing putative transcriptional regulator [Actinocatenispora thailandica]BCJ37783.1 SARP family transcriptional regulator [Actinocatenispora thailandica]